MNRRMEVGGYGCYGYCNCYSSGIFGFDVFCHIFIVVFQIWRERVNEKCLIFYFYNKNPKKKKMI